MTIEVARSILEAAGHDFPDGVVGVFAKKLTKSSSYATPGGGHGVHIEITDPTSDMLLFPVVSSSIYLKTQDPEEKRRFVGHLPVTFERRMLEALCTRALKDVKRFRLTESELQGLLTSVQASPAEIEGTIETRYNVRTTTGQQQTELHHLRIQAGPNDLSDSKLDAFGILRHLLLAGDMLVLLQLADGSYQGIGIAEEDVPTPAPTTVTPGIATSIALAPRVKSFAETVPGEPAALPSDESRPLMLDEYQLTAGPDGTCHVDVVATRGRPLLGRYITLLDSDGAPRARGRICRATVLWAEDGAQTMRLDFDRFQFATAETD